MNNIKNLLNRLNTESLPFSVIGQEGIIRELGEIGDSRAGPPLLQILSSTHQVFERANFDIERLRKVLVEALSSIVNRNQATHPELYIKFEKENATISIPVEHLNIPYEEPTITESESFRISKYVERIDLSNRYLYIEDEGYSHLPLIREIDLSQLKECQKLKNLNLSGNNLHFVNLQPLEHCKELESIDLRENDFESIEISQLFSCPKLAFLYLDSVRIEANIDLQRKSNIPPAIQDVKNGIHWISNKPCIDD